jgi:squalene cyclase
MKLLGFTAEEMGAATKELLSLQRDDGGWNQLPEMESDPYATGTVLVALRDASIQSSDAAYQRGLRFLLKTQQGDGSWHVKSRSKPFQTYFETGFPHGKDQFISAAASGWATTALALALDKDR